MREYRWPVHGVSTTVLLYGCMNIGGSWDDTPVEPGTRAAAFEALDSAYDSGYRAFDHADIYCAGKSESVFGEWLREHPGLRDSVFIQSKCGIRPGSPVMYDFSHDHIVRSVEGSLSRLGVDTLDVLLLHRPDPLVEPGEVARAFDELHQAGKVRSFGVSNHSAMQMELLQSSLGRPLVANQMEVSLDHPDLIVAGTAVNQRDPAHQLRHGDTLEYCRMEGVTIQAWSALAHGKFSGREQNDAAGLVDHLAGVYGTSREAIVLGWILRHPAPILPVVGTTNPDRIRASAAAPEVFLEREHWYALTEAARRMGMP